MVSLAGRAPAGFWDVWVTRTPGNLLASLTLVPVILTWWRTELSEFRTVPARCYVEAGLLVAGLLAVCAFVFVSLEEVPPTAPVLLYVPLPFLVWAAVRFGPRGTSTCLLLVGCLAIWGAVHGHGPFVSRSAAENALSIQLFLAMVSVPLLTLAAVMREREQSQVAARRYQERLDLALSASQVGTWEWCIADNTGSMSPKSRQILGVPDSDEVVTQNDFLNLVSSQDRAAVAQTMLDCMSTGAPYECEFRVPQAGGVRWVLAKGKVLYDPLGKPDRFLGVNVDITDQKSAAELRHEEVALRQSEARFRELADTMPQIVWSAGPGGQLEYFNQRWYGLTGAESASTEEANWLSMTHPDDRQALLQAWRESVRTGQPCQVEHRLKVHTTGQYRWHLARALPVRDGNGAVIRWYGSCTDIEDQKLVERKLRNARLELEERVAERTTELSSAVIALRDEIADRIAAERALRSSEERFGKAFHSSPDAIAIVRQSDYGFIEVNEKWEAMFGFCRAEVLGRTSYELGLALLSEESAQARDLLDSSGSLRDYEIDVRNKAGDVFRIIMVADTVEMAGEDCYIIIIRDVTERKRSQALLQEQQRELAHLSRVAALGELSGTLAHELNQPLAAILANARAAERILSTNVPNITELREILKDIAFDDRRAGEVISRLRGLLKKGDPQLRPVRLEDIVQEVTTLLHSELIERRVSVEAHLSTGMPLVLGDRVQLQQVLLNMMMNACDAMADQPAATRKMVIATTLTPEGRVQLSVKDSGVGVPPSRLEQIFDPFVTTKDHGLGLGLAICRSIVTAHGGRLWALNNPERGASMLMALDPIEDGHGQLAR
jgi:PAS domain S-box-containing protein